MDSRIEKMVEIGTARAKASFAQNDEDLLEVAEICRKYLGKDTLADRTEKSSLTQLFNSKLHQEVRLALNIIAAEHAREVLQSEETASGLGADDLQQIFGYANLNTAIWNMVDDWGTEVEMMLTRFPELTPDRVNAVMPDFSRPAFVRPARLGGYA